MKQKIIELLINRMSKELTPQNPVSFIKEVNMDLVYSSLINTVYQYTRNGKGVNKNVYLAEVATAIGNAIRTKSDLKLNSGLNAKTGAFLLYTLEVFGLISVCMTKGENKHQAFVVELVDDHKLGELWCELEQTHVEKLPSLAPYESWKVGVHSTGVNLVKTQCPTINRILTAEKYPIVFEAINKSQQVGWMINESIYDLHLWALRNRTEAFQEIWDMQSPMAKQSKIREAKAIGSIAKRFIGKVFYH